ncbi:hypothetical protein [Vibrio sp. D431a]|uniref:hypothetical protein n=1 Tax=Vibrio sp. D431a TaxID=2837388 RepID=UPI002554C457|nr:hypothetical protein [Vibrio sp. D431a]MDK9793789.1 hypothetical protein [Vibrio sp. D431a]
MEHSTVLKREDGSQVKITVFLRALRLEEPSLRFEVETKAKGKRKFMPLVDTKKPSYRQLTKEEREQLKKSALDSVVTESEIIQAQQNLYENMHSLFTVKSDMVL